MVGTDLTALIETLERIETRDLFVYVLAVAALGALRRLWARSPGALFGFFPILGLVVALQWREVLVLRVGVAAREDVWTVSAEENRRDGRGERLSAASWDALQRAILSAGGPVRLTARGDLRSAWFDPDGIALDLGNLRAPDIPSAGLEALLPATASLHHGAQVEAHRSFAIELDRSALPESRLTAETWTLHAWGRGRSEPALLLTGEVLAGVVRTSLTVPEITLEPGEYVLRAASQARPQEVLLSRLVVLPRPEVVAVGEGTGPLVSALTAQGYSVDRLAPAELAARLSATRPVRLLLLGENCEEVLASARDHARAGGGLLIAGEGTWEAFAAHEDLRDALPVWPRDPLPPEESEGNSGESTNEKDPRETQGTNEQNPEGARPETAQAGSFGLLLLLDVSGSFRRQLPTAWEHAQVALRESEGFDHAGLIGFARSRKAAELVPFGPVDEGLEERLRAARPKLDQAIEDALREGETFLVPGLEMARDALAGKDLSGKLVILVSDGGFSDLREEWIRLAKEIVQDGGAQIGTIFMRSQRPPPGGFENLHQLARIGRTGRAREVRDLRSALRLVPVIAREVAKAGTLPPPPGGRKDEGKDPKSPDKVPDQEPKREPRRFHLVRTGLHPAEGDPKEFAGEEWPAFLSYRPGALRTGTGVAWRVRETRDVLVATGFEGRGKVGVLCFDVSQANWPGALEDPRFPLFVARLADYLRTSPEAPRPERWRADGTFLLRSGQVTRLEEVNPTLGLPASLAVAGTWRRNVRGEVFSSLGVRPGPGAGQEGEQLPQHLFGGAGGALPAVQQSERIVRRIHPMRLGLLVGAGLVLEILGIALRLRRTYQQR